MATATITEKDLARRVLMELGLLDSNDEPTAQDQADVIQIYREKHAELEHENEAYWPPDQIPVTAVPGLAMVVAYACSGIFRVQYPPEKDARGYTLLRRLARMAPTNEIIPAEYF